MKIPPNYRLTKKISSHIASIEANRQVIDHIKIPLEVEENIRRRSTFCSSLFSARIEGNSLTLSQVSSFQDLSGKDQEKIEIANIYRTINHVISKTKNEYVFSKKDVLSWHGILMKNILGDSYVGRFRTKHEGIFDSVGNLVYHSPPPSEVSELMDELVRFINSKREKIVPIRAILAHFVLERIHPFVDGSGRMGRLLQIAVLNQGGFGMKGLATVEEEISENRSSYYLAIERSSGADATEFVDFMLELLDKTTTRLKEELLAKSEFSPEDTLLPRRKELLDIIRDQRIVSLDFLSRRFLKVDPRLLRNDLMSLSKLGYIEKLGKTRGALYTVKKS